MHLRQYSESLLCGAGLLPVRTAFTQLHCMQPTMIAFTSNWRLRLAQASVSCRRSTRTGWLRLRLTRTGLEVSGQALLRSSLGFLIKRLIHVMPKAGGAPLTEGGDLYWKCASPPMNRRQELQQQIIGRAKHVEP